MHSWLAKVLSCLLVMTGRRGRPTNRSRLLPRTETQLIDTRLSVCLEGRKTSIKQYKQVKLESGTLSPKQIIRGEQMQLPQSHLRMTAM